MNTLCNKNLSPLMMILTLVFFSQITNADEITLHSDIHKKIVKFFQTTSEEDSDEKEHIQEEIIKYIYQDIKTYPDKIKEFGSFYAQYPDEVLKLGVTLQKEWESRYLIKFLEKHLSSQRSAEFVSYATLALVSGGFHIATNFKALTWYAKVFWGIITLLSGSSSKHFADQISENDKALKDIPLPPAYYLAFIITPGFVTGSFNGYAFELLVLDGLNELAKNETIINTGVALGTGYGLSKIFQLLKLGTKAGGGLSLGTMILVAVLTYIVIEGIEEGESYLDESKLKKKLNERVQKFQDAVATKNKAIIIAKTQKLIKAALGLVVFRHLELYKTLQEYFIKLRTSESSICQTADEEKNKVFFQTELTQNYSNAVTNFIYDKYPNTKYAHNEVLYNLVNRSLKVIKIYKDQYEKLTHDKFISVTKNIYVCRPTVGTMTWDTEICGMKTITVPELDPETHKKVLELMDFFVDSLSEDKAYTFFSKVQYLDPLFNRYQTYSHYLIYSRDWLKKNTNISDDFFDFLSDELPIKENLELFELVIALRTFSPQIGSVQYDDLMEEGDAYYAGKMDDYNKLHTQTLTRLDQQLKTKITTWINTQDEELSDSLRRGNIKSDPTQVLLQIAALIRSTIHQTGFTYLNSFTVEVMSRIEKNYIFINQALKNNFYQEYDTYTKKDFEKVFRDIPKEFRLI